MTLLTTRSGASTLAHSHRRDDDVTKPTSTRLSSIMIQFSRHSGRVVDVEVSPCDNQNKISCKKIPKFLVLT
jgi:hypothetical protein